MQIDNRFTQITDGQFEAAWAAADRRSEKDYRHCSQGPLIQFAHCGGRVTHMRYIGGDRPGSLRCNQKG